MEAYIQKLENRQDLNLEEIQAAFKPLIDGTATHSQIERFLTALNQKGPTIEEITGAAQFMRQHYLPVQTKHPVVLDTCGTGGDKKGTFNISTIVALVVAGAGVVVAKHGNRSVSSRCGSADLLEALGVNLHVSQRHLGECLDKVGIAFLFAQKHHPAMKHVAPVRKALGTETIFNLLGPLLNPAQATHQMMGVYRQNYVEPLAHVLKNLKLRRALVVHGSDGLDEITTTAKTFASEFDGQTVLSYEIDPEQYGFRRATDKDLHGGELATNMAIARDILQGGKGFKRDIVVLNAAHALYCAEKAPDVFEGIKIAEQSLDSRAAFEKLEELKTFTNKYGAAVKNQD